MSGSDETPAIRPVARPFGVWTAAALVVGGMIGAGIFVMPAQLAPYGWTGTAAWATAIPGALLLAFVLSRLAAARPDASGAVAIVGDVLGPMSGLLVGWSYWVGICAANAIIAVTAVRYGATFAPALTASPLATAAAATTLVWALTALNLGGVKGAGRFQVLTTVLKLLPLIAVVLILAGLAVTDTARFGAHAHKGFVPTEFTTALTLAFFPLVGFEAACLAAERVRDPARNVLRATLFGTALTGLLYVIISNGVVFALPEATVAAAGAPIAMFVETFWGRAAGVSVGMARSRLVPAVLGRTSDRDVPTLAILIASAFTSFLILSGAIPGLTGVLTFMLQLTTAATVWLYVGACVAALRLKIAPPAAFLGLGFSAWVLWGSGMQALLLSILLMLTAVPLYWLRPLKA
jgi:APA family basic amino acid/polyamine antiporter